MLRFRLLFILVLLLPEFLMADDTPVLARTGKVFDPAIPTIQSVLGYDFGEHITRHASMERYLNALAESTAKIRIQKIGQTYEGRALYYAIVSSEENMRRLEELRQANLQLAEPRTIASSQADAIIDTNPIFVGLNYSVHGNEHSGVEAGLAMIYYLVAANDVEIQQLLKNVVVIIDPMQNPDGRERFIQYFYSMSGKKPNPDGNAAEHNEDWPRGRTNHYLFDMNRDWSMMTQQETQARIEAYRKFQPQVFIDLHEMGGNSTYFFPPPTIPQNPNLAKSTIEWWNILGKAIASEFDKHQVDYYTQEKFDFWYPGYGDSWPTYNGALAGTFEQGSARGLVLRRDDGDMLHYKDAVWHHFLSSLATCRLASTQRKEKLRDFYEFRSGAVREGKTGPVKQYLLKRAGDPQQTDRMAALLLRHGIEVRQADADFRASATGYLDDKSESRNFQKGDYIIAMDQPLKRLIQVFFERESKFDTSFLEAEETRRKDQEPTELYDITAWSLPLATGLDAYWSGDITTASSTLLTEIPKSRPPLSPATYAYLLPYRSNQDIATVVTLLNRGVRVRFTSLPFTRDQRRFGAGSFIIRVKENGKELAQTLGEISEATGAEFVATSTGWTEEGPDLGSDDVGFLKQPKVAIVTNMPTDPTSYGAINYLFDQRYNLDFTAINAFQLQNVELNDYNVLILPDSGGGGLSYKQVLGSDTGRLKSWIENGGTLIAMAGSSNFLIDDETLTDVRRIRRFLRNSADPAVEKEEKKEDIPAKEPETESADTIPGSIARAQLYSRSFLAYGYGQTEIPVFVNSSNVFAAPENLKPAVSYADASRIKISGIFWEISKKRLEKRAYATVEDLGSGHVILFAEEPTFRANWEGLDKLFMNGVLFGPSM